MPQQASEADTAALQQESYENPVFHHINLKTGRLDEMIDWYGVVVGAKANFRSDSVAFLTNDAANHRIALFGADHFADDPDRATHAGMHHSAFECSSLGQLLELYGRLKAKGIVPPICVDHGLTMSFYYSDPDGNAVEIQSDNFGDWAASTEWLRTSPEFVADPIGAPVDPDQLVAAWREGMESSEIHRRAYGGEFGPAVPPDLTIR